MSVLGGLTGIVFASIAVRPKMSDYFPTAFRSELNQADAFSRVGVNVDFASMLESESTRRSNVESMDAPVDDAAR